MMKVSAYIAIVDFISITCVHRVYLRHLYDVFVWRTVWVLENETLFSLLYVLVIMLIQN